MHFPSFKSSKIVRTMLCLYPVCKNVIILLVKSILVSIASMNVHVPNRLGKAGLYCTKSSYSIRPTKPVSHPRLDIPETSCH